MTSGHVQRETARLATSFEAVIWQSCIIGEEWRREIDSYTPLDPYVHRHEFGMHRLVVIRMMASMSCDYLADSIGRLRDSHENTYESILARAHRRGLTFIQKKLFSQIWAPHDSDLVLPPHVVWVCRFWIRSGRTVNYGCEC